MPYSLHDAVYDALNRSPNPSEFVYFEDGSRCRVKIVIDEHSSLEDDGDWFGSLHWPNGGDSGRPSQCDGSAMKLRTRGGFVWWMPPKDIKGDVEAVEQLRNTVAGYFLEQWYYVGIVLEYDSPPCPHCNERKNSTESVWGIESNANIHYFCELADDLLFTCKND